MNWASPLVRWGLGAVVLFLLLSLTLFTVAENEQAVVLRLGKIDRTYNRYEPGRAFGATNTGLRPRIPFYEQVVLVDKRVQAVEMEQQQVLSTDQLRLQVDAFALFRIVDPRQMIESVGQAQPVDRVKDALRPILGSALRNELGKREFVALLSPERGRVMNNIQARLDGVAKQYGAEIVDVRINRADLPTGTPLDSAFERMRSARNEKARTIEAQGRKVAQITRATADAQAANTYAEAFNKDPNFYDFYRAMQSYRQTFLSPDGESGSANVLLSPDNEYLQQFRGRKGP